jgi:hypothetical protein
MAITDQINNYYEQAVSEEIHLQLSKRETTPAKDFMSDVACVALNRLPPKYYRHDVDMSFYMTVDELIEVKEKVVAAVTDAILFVESHARSE